MEKLQELLKQLVSSNPYAMESHPQGVIVPIYWSEDKDGNINFDVDSIRDEFESLLSQLESHNDETEFDWDSQ
jgi:hypothetical protein